MSGVGGTESAISIKNDVKRGLMGDCESGKESVIKASR